MDAQSVLTTTRSVRKRLDLQRPVPRELLLECLEVAVQAPTGSNSQGWQFVIVTDPDKKRVIGDLYRESWTAYAANRGPRYERDDPRRAQLPRVATSAQYLADHMHEVPAMVIPCIEGRADRPGVSNLEVAGLYGSILPAAWSFLLAARDRGLVGAWTTLHLKYEREVATCWASRTSATRKQRSSPSVSAPVARSSRLSGSPWGASSTGRAGEPGPARPGRLAAARRRPLPHQRRGRCRAVQTRPRRAVQDAPAVADRARGARILPRPSVLSL